MGQRTWWVVMGVIVIIIGVIWYAATPRTSPTTAEVPAPMTEPAPAPAPGMAR